MSEKNSKYHQHQEIEKLIKQRFKEFICDKKNQKEQAQKEKEEYDTKMFHLLQKTKKSLAKSKKIPFCPSQDQISKAFSLAQETASNLDNFSQNQIYQDQYQLQMQKNIQQKNQKKGKLNNKRPFSASNKNLLAQYKNPQISAIQRHLNNLHKTKFNNQQKGQNEILKNLQKTNVIYNQDTQLQNQSKNDNQFQQQQQQDQLEQLEQLDLKIQNFNAKKQLSSNSDHQIQSLINELNQQHQNLSQNSQNEQKQEKFNIQENDKAEEFQFQQKIQEKQEEKKIQEQNQNQKQQEQQLQQKPENSRKQTLNSSIKNKCKKNSTGQEKHTINGYNSNSKQSLKNKKQRKKMSQNLNNKQLQSQQSQQQYQQQIQQQDDEGQSEEEDLQVILQKSSTKLKSIDQLRLNKTESSSSVI
ncbi:hypothetical protein PPERSA_01373 [Pseudocohnilembus persalinus]|uniref:Uncharacterized protein n=1 Tax=Pseudocohnilembus persalinus TaxID=266149 RepID=A0A0V0QH02_PSEPJ|nr:hypothetical protein PPERSA_01373 [Pseudocohnilembus persalinus]|eukprot:KRX01470.1 hypothetical protein PPERSA_01373 [Pseudocohnilembus persalinus]